MAEKELYRIPGSKNQFEGIIQSVILSLCFLLSLVIGTQYIAWNTGRDGFYNPFLGLLWGVQAEIHQENTAIYVHGLQMTMALIVASFFVVHIVFMISRRRVKESDIHGSSKWAGYEELKKMDLLDKDDGLYIGGWYNPKNHCIEYLRENSPTHMMVVAPPRSGKGVGVVIPNLLTFKGSIIVFDIKGENYEITSGRRKVDLNNVILRFDPSSINPNGARFNPLFDVRIGDYEFGDAHAIAEMMIDPDKEVKYDHWKRSAITLLTVSILHTLYSRKDKTLTGVVNLLSDPNKSIHDVIEAMIMTEHDPQGKYGWLDSEKKPTKVHPIIASMGGELKKKSYEEMQGIISTFSSYLTIYRDPIIARNTSQSDFTIEDLIRGDRPRSLYINVPPSNLQRMVPLTRLILNQVLHRIMDNKNLIMRGGKNENLPLLMMLDEFNALGKMEILKDSLSYAAQYGLRACLIIQDLNQLDQLYGQNNPLLSYCHIRIAHATNSETTARRISLLAGDQTIVKYSSSYSDGSTNTNTSQTEIKRPLIMPDEVLRLPKDEMLIFIEGEYPIRGKKIVYHKDKAFKEMAKIPPVEKSDVLPVKNEFTLINDVVEYQKPKFEDVVVNEKSRTPMGLGITNGSNSEQGNGVREKGLIKKQDIRNISSSAENILEKLIEVEIVAEANTTNVRLIANLDECIEKIKDIAGDDFNQLWTILNKAKI
jgi:type IV secretion system protein VirD4